METHLILSDDAGSAQSLFFMRKVHMRGFVIARFT